MISLNGNGVMFQEHQRVLLCSRISGGQIFEEGFVGSLTLTRKLKRRIPGENVLQGSGVKNRPVLLNKPLK